MYTLLKKTVSIFVIAAMVLMPVRVYADPALDALPVLSGIVGGDASGTVATGGTVSNPTMTVTQNVDKMIGNWTGFDIGANAAVNFNQPGAASIALNRVSGIAPSQIFGQLSANGRVFIVNPNGVLFGPGSHVDTAGLLASSLDISNTDFMNGTYSFAGHGGAVVNQGALNAPGGFVALLGSHVENSGTGTVVANLGTIALLSGEAITLGLDGQSLISVVINQATSSNPGSVDAAVANLGAGKLTANGGKVLLNAQTLEGVFAKAINNEGVIEAGASESNNGVVELIANHDIKSSGTISAASRVTIDSTDGDVLLDGGSVSAVLNGSGMTQVDIEGNNITLNDASVTAQSLGGDNDWAEVDMLGNVNILNGSSVLAKTSSVLDGSQVYIRGGDILIDNSSVTAEVGGNANGSAKVFLGVDPKFSQEGDVFTNNISILNHSTVSANMANGNTDAMATVEMDLTGTLDIEDSTISAIAGVSESEGTPEAIIDLNLFGKGEGNVIISGSELTAQVNGDGEAKIVVYDSDTTDELWLSLQDIFGSSNDPEGPINGSISIADSTIHAEAASSQVFDLTNFNFDDSHVAIIGMMSQGPITLKNSEISAQEQNFPAIVGLLTDTNVSVDADSAITATADDSVAAVAILAMGSDEGGRSIDIAGTVSADAGEGLGLVALLGDEDVNAAGTVEASGSLDTLGLLESLVANYTNYTVDLGVDETIGSAVVIGSLNGDVTLGEVSADLVGVAALGMDDENGKGNIFDAGTVSGKALLLLARRNIGTSAEPLNTNVDVIAGYSWDQGDIYINEANDVTLGLYLPSISISDGESTYSLDLGISLAANDGDINVVSGGDMLVNSVIAANGGVYLDSTEGSISTGHGWDPRISQDVVDQIGSLGSTLAGDLGFDVSAEDISSIVGQALMDNPFYGEADSSEYISPIMIGSPIGNGPNVVALGNSDVPAEVVLRAQDGDVVVDGGSIMALNSGSGDALVTLIAEYGDVLVSGGEVFAQTYSGDATVRMDATGYNGDADGWIAGNVKITDGSSVKAEVISQPQPEPSPSSSPSISESEVVSNSGNGNALVELNYGDVGCVGIGDGSRGAILVDGSDVTAKVENGGTAYIYIGDGSNYSDVSILNGSNVLASIGYNQPYADTAAINIYGIDITIDGSLVQALSTDPAQTGSASIYMQSNDNGNGNGGLITINNSTVEANVAGNGSASIQLNSYRYNYETSQYEGAIDVLGGSSILSSVGSGSALTQFYADDINVVGSTLRSTVRDNVDGGTAYLYLYPYNYYYNQDNSITIDSSMLEASTVGRGTAAIALGSDNWNSNYNYGSGSIDITNGSSLLASVGGGQARVWAWADDIYVANSTLKALSTAGMDAAYSNAYIYLYAYNYNYYNRYDYSDTHLTLDNASLTSDVNGLGQAYMYVLAWRSYYYSYDYGNSTLDILNSSLLSTVGHGQAYTEAQSMGHLNVADSTITARSQALLDSSESGNNNQAYVQLYSYDYYNNSEGADDNLTVTNSDIVGEVLGDGYSQVHLYNYGDYNGSGSGNSSIILNNSTLRSSVTGAGSAYVYLQGYDYNYNTSDILLNNSQLSSFVGDGWSEVYIYANYGSILGDATSLLTADWVYLYALNNIGTFESPINTDTHNLTAYSTGDPVWVPDVVEEPVNPEEVTLFSGEQSGHYLYGTGNIYVNNIGTDLLNVGSYDDYEEDGGPVQSNNGVVNVTTQGDMVIHNAIAENGGVFLESQNGSIFAGLSRDGEDGANVIAGGYSYISAPNGMVGVGEPGDAFDGISGQIQGVVDPGTTAVTGVNPAPGLDLRFSEPEGYVYYQGDSEPAPEPSPSPSPDVESISQELSVIPAPIQSIWPTVGSIGEMNNPLKVNIQLIEGTPSAVPVGFTPVSALTLRLGENRQGVDPGLMVNPLNRNPRVYYEFLRLFRYTSFEPTTPTGFYAYHPLSDADTEAYNDIGLDPKAYEFIDGNLKYNGDEDPYKKKKQI